MRKNMISGALAFVLALSMSILSSAQPQSKGQGEAQKAKPASSKSGTFTFLPHTDLETLMKTNGDHPARVVDIAKSYNLGAYLLHFDARPPAKALNGWAHNDISELYYVVRGAGTFLIGGELENPTKDDPNGESVKTVRGPSVSGQIKGYTAQKYVAGDIMIIPVGVPHLPGYEVTEKTDIVRVVIDPEKALNLK
jgi:mannose-6-phosphate isomerase-like protein (cupin superfamily)